MSSTVFLARTSQNASSEEIRDAALKVFEAAKVNDTIGEGEYVAIKIHVGDKTNTTHIPVELIAGLVAKIKEKDALPFMTETSTLYKGVRENAVKHIMHAYDHGFNIQNTGAPFIMADGLAGDSEIEVPIDGILNKTVSVAREARMADFLLIVSHMTGHLGTGFGATLKNVGMGLATRKGKMRQHSDVNPEVISDSCVLCHKCMQWCPKDAICEIEGSAYINLDLCVGCGECLAVCRVGAIKFDFGKESGLLQQNMAEHAMGILKDKKSFFINVCNRMTKDCDCFAINQKPFMPDIGVVGSWDPVACDQAALDLTKEMDGIDIVKRSNEHLDGNIQLEHAEKIGMGSRQYELVTL